MNCRRKWNALRVYFFATTNWMDKMDRACLRRFSHKVKFEYLTANQRWGLFVQEFGRLGAAMLGDP